MPPSDQPLSHSPPPPASLPQVNAMRRHLELRISGFDAPRPIKLFEHCGFPAPLMAAVAKAGYEKPTAIQAQVLPAALSGRDVLVSEGDWWRDGRWRLADVQHCRFPFTLSSLACPLLSPTHSPLASPLLSPTHSPLTLSSPLALRASPRLGAARQRPSSCR